MEFTVRMYDIDFNGHVSNIVYIRWLEDMRMVGFEKIASIRDCLEAGQVPVLLNTSIEYKLPIYMFEKAKGLLWVSGFSKTTFRIEAEITVKDKICAKAWQTCVFISQKTNRATRMPQAVLAKLEKVIPPSPKSAL
ncbi:MAG: thioesterase [Candidatus Melainabacteria bacterium]|nr:MAG: thioesterase [Candidatus Melainabacteria bacterium]